VLAITGKSETGEKCAEKNAGKISGKKKKAGENGIPF
jgi:hypothetical protein